MKYLIIITLLVIITGFPSLGLTAPGTVTTISNTAFTNISGNGGKIKATSAKDTFKIQGATINPATKTITVPSIATQITYNAGTVADALDQLLYQPITISSFTMSGGGNVTQEIGSNYTITGSGLVWATNKTATTQTVNSVARTSPYMPSPSTLSSNTTYTLSVSDGTSTANSTRSVTFTHKRYWGVSANETLSDANIIALSSEYSTSRGQTRSMTAAGQYLWIVYVETAGSPTVTVNGFPDTSWVALVRNFTNSSGNTSLFRIYRSSNPLTGTYTVVIS